MSARAVPGIKSVSAICIPLHIFHRWSLQGNIICCAGPGGRTAAQKIYTTGRGPSAIHSPGQNGAADHEKGNRGGANIPFGPRACLADCHHRVHATQHAHVRCTQHANSRNTHTRAHTVTLAELHAATAWAGTPRQTVNELVTVADQIAEHSCDRLLQLAAPDVSARWLPTLPMPLSGRQWPLHALLSA